MNINANSEVPVSIVKDNEIKVEHKGACRHIRSGFTSDNEPKKRKNRIRTKIAKESRRKNR